MDNTQEDAVCTVDIDLTNETLAILALQAHELDMTLNAHIIQLLKKYVKELQTLKRVELFRDEYDGTLVFKSKGMQKYHGVAPSVKGFDTYVYDQMPKLKTASTVMYENEAGCLFQQSKGGTLKKVYPSAFLIEEESE